MNPPRPTPVPRVARACLGLAVTAALTACFPWDLSKSDDETDKVDDLQITAERFVDGEVMARPAAGEVTHHAYEFDVHTELGGFAYYLTVTPASASATPASGGSTTVYLGQGKVSSAKNLVCTPDRSHCTLDCTVQIHPENAALREVNCHEDKQAAKGVTLAPGRYSYELTVAQTVSISVYPWIYSGQATRQGMLTLE